MHTIFIFLDQRGNREHSEISDSILIALKEDLKSNQRAIDCVISTAGTFNTSCSIY